MRRLKNIILKGIPASPGNVKGRVKIIKNQKDTGKLKYGDIIITSFLNPVYLASFKKNPKVAGMITESVISKKKRVGFYVTDWQTKEREIFAHIDFDQKTS